MGTIDTLRMRREAILAEMRSLDTMRRGTINEQYFRRGGKSANESTGRRGPYYVFSRREGSHTRSRRLKTAEELAKARQAIAAHKRFLALCEEFVRTTEQLGDLVGREDGAEKEKKQRRPPSNRTRK